MRRRTIFQAVGLAVAGVKFTADEPLTELDYEPLPPPADTKAGGMLFGHIKNEYGQLGDGSMDANPGAMEIYWADEAGEIVQLTNNGEPAWNTSKH